MQPITAAKFCMPNYGASFPLFTRRSVTGDDASLLYRRLIDKTGGAPGWNFNKCLAGRDGKPVVRNGLRVEPAVRKPLKAIDAGLAKPVP